MVLHFCPSFIEKLQEAAKLVTTLQEQVVLSLQTSFREGRISESVTSCLMVRSLQTTFFRSLTHFLNDLLRKGRAQRGDFFCI